MNTQHGIIQGSDGTPPEPDWKKIYRKKPDRAAATADWGRVIRDMREANTLSVANGHAIRRLVEFRVQYELASREVAKDDAVTKADKHASTGVWNPWWSIMRQADDSIRTLESELGISPRQREKAGKVKRKAGAARAADNYLRALPSG